jgi:opacity protein-like surface antigen
VKDLENKMKKIITLVILLLTTTMMYSQSKVGTTAANFLTIPVGPRASSMGSAFTAVADDATSAFWNPGGLSRVTRSEFTASTAEWLVGTRLNWIGLAYKLDENNSFGISINQLDYGEEDITTPEQPAGTGAKWSASDLAIGLSYARNLTDRFSIGTTVKYISQNIWNESATAFALDIGLLFYTELEGLRLGMNISNFGTEMKLAGKDLLRPIDIDPANTGNNPNIAGSLETDAWPLPLIFSVGIAYDLNVHQDWLVRFASDAVIPSNYSTYGNLGAEVTWNNIISLRAGYKGINYLVDDKAKQEDRFEEGLTAGIGVQYDFGGFFVKFDYGYSDLGIFSEISRFSLSVGL